MLRETFNRVRLNESTIKYLTIAHTVEKWQRIVQLKENYMVISPLRATLQYLTAE